MKKFHWKKAEKDFIENACRYAGQLKKKSKQPGIRDCHRICQNSFGDFFSSMPKFMQTIIRGRLREAFQMHLKGIDSDLKFSKFLQTYVVEWFYAYRDAQKYLGKLKPIKPLSK